jgi:hypothetical protein
MLSSSPRRADEIPRLQHRRCVGLSDLRAAANAKVLRTELLAVQARGDSRGKAEWLEITGRPTFATPRAPLHKNRRPHGGGLQLNGLIVPNFQLTP